MDKLVLNARTRTETGKYAISKLRKTGRFPAVVYNTKGQSTMLDLDSAEFARVRKCVTPTTLFALSVDGKTELQVLLKDVQYNILTEENMHADFHAISDDKPLKKIMKIQLTGSPAGVREGGVFFPGIGEVVIQCLPKNLPVRITADVSGLGLGSQITISDLKFAEGITVLSNPDAVVAQVRMGKV